MHDKISKCREDVQKLISAMVKHLARVLCKWLVIRSSPALYLSKGLQRLPRPAPGGLVNIVGMKHPMAKPENLSFFFFFFESLYFVVTTNLIWGLLSLFLSSCIVF